MPGPRAQARGFTLLELMAAVAVVAILALIALPAYSRYVQQGRLSEAPALLAAHAAALEQRFMETRRYGDDGRCPGVEGSHFIVTCRLVPGGYRLTARNRTVAGLGAEGRYVYTLDAEGHRRTLRYDGEVRDLPCWQVRPEATCP